MSIKNPTRSGRLDIPVKYRDGQWEYLPPGTIMTRRGVTNHRWALRLCRGSSMTLPDGTACRVMSWEEEARALRKQLNEWAIRERRENAEALTAAACSPPDTNAEPRAFAGVVSRMLDAAEKAEREAEAHPDRERRIYCGGTAHGLKAAAGMMVKKPRKEGAL